MPTVAEMQLLNNAAGDLSSTLLRNRMMGAEDKERRARETLEREMMGLRREDQQDARSVRREGLQSQQAHQQRLEAFQQAAAAAKTEEQKLAALKEFAPYMDDAAIEKMAKVLSEKMGFEVTLKRPASGPRTMKTPAGAELAWMEGGKDLNVTDRPQAAKPAGRRTLKVGEDDRDTITQDLSREELDALMRKGMAGEEEGLEQEISEQALKEPGIPAHGPPPGRTAGGDRVTVIDPAGRRGTIPRAQLKEALAKGFKLAQ